WRGSTKWAAWLTVAFSATVFFIVPSLMGDLSPDLRTNPAFTKTNDFVTTIIHREAAPADVEKRQAAIEVWDETKLEIENASDLVEKEKALEALGPRPEPLQVGQQMQDIYKTGGKPIYWSTVQPAPETKLKEVSRSESGNTIVITEVYDGPVTGDGYFNLDFLLYEKMGVDLTRLSG